MLILRALNNQASLIQFINVYTFLFLDREVIIFGMHFQEYIFIFRFKNPYCRHFLTLENIVREVDHIQFPTLYLWVNTLLIQMLGNGPRLLMQVFRCFKYLLCISINLVQRQLRFMIKFVKGIEFKGRQEIGLQ
ncbi:hypothetical protein D3C80_1837180 [compost metagenome]